MRFYAKTTISALTAALAVASTVAIPATASASQARATRPAALYEDPAYFEMSDITQHTFVVKLTDPAEIEHARELLDGDTTDRPALMGRIVPFPAPYNRQWSYHLAPDSIRFFDFAIEVCDATIPYVEEHLAEAGGAFLPGMLWCPWSSHLVRELPAP